MEDLHTAPNFCSELNSVANVQDLHRVVNFLADDDNFHNEIVVDQTVDEGKFCTKCYFGQLSIGYFGDNRQEAVNVGIEKMAKVLDFMLEKNMIYKIFQKPLVFDILSIDTNTGLRLNQDLSEAIQSRYAHKNASWRANPRHVVNNVLLLFMFFPTVEYIGINDDKPFEDYNEIKRKLSIDFNSNVDLYPFNVLDEGEIASNTLLVANAPKNCWNCGRQMKNANNRECTYCGEYNKL